MIWDCSWQTFILMLTVWLQCTKPTHLIKQGSCFSLLFRLPTWLRGDSTLCPSSSPKKQTQHNRAWWSETAPDKPSSWCWQFDCNAPSPPISVVVNDYSFILKFISCSVQGVCDWKINVNHFCLLKLFFILFKLFVIEESTNSYDI